MFSRVLDFAKDRAGTVMIEFVLVLPVLLVLLLGVLQFGLLYYQYTALTGATAAGARQFSLSGTAPYSNTVDAITNATCNPSSSVCALQSANLTITLAVNGTACTSDTSCSTALSAAYTASQPITVTVSYACTLLMPTSWINLTGICPITLTLAQRVQIQA